MNSKFKPWIGFFYAGLTLLVLSSLLISCQPPRQATQPILLPTVIKITVSSASPTPDRLAEPPLPANPTQLELGRHLFWLNCMPCHGDRGQGLTVEFRSLYVEDADCWARGCHGGRTDDKGFPIPRAVPAIVSATGDLPPFATAQDLFDFLHTTHPPQDPGFLAEADYWALTAYLLAQNGRLAAGSVLGP